MGRTNPRKKVAAPAKISRGSNSVAESQAEQFGLTKTSGYRSPEESIKVGGHAKDDHTSGTASDFAGTPEKMDAFAKWAVESGQFTKVIWKGRDLISGAKIPGHEDHVHVSWKG